MTTAFRTPATSISAPRGPAGSSQGSKLCRTDDSRNSSSSCRPARTICRHGRRKSPPSRFGRNGISLPPSERICRTRPRGKCVSTRDRKAPIVGRIGSRTAARDRSTFAVRRPNEQARLRQILGCNASFAHKHNGLPMLRVPKGTAAIAVMANLLALVLAAIQGHTAWPAATERLLATQPVLLHGAAEA
eukprot:CAMPEP_0170201612 /NCGR_PEP_ID=MMETSP0116_2-20130129/264_1 /TAXON_ID=400756 /ORGANISM="Durinskia baltica, Strain CSIRO CS-38" /LENGTH=188 /DNA_ID=CAMNT_0010451831 /DNA_START=63 /DNA_END=627 /DNA_ORIENTATION=-